MKISKNPSFVQAVCVWMLCALVGACLPETEPTQTSAAADCPVDGSGGGVATSGAGASASNGSGAGGAAAGCPAEVQATMCPGLASTIQDLEFRCSVEVPAECSFVPSGAHLRVVSTGCWDGACPEAVPPWALYLGTGTCALGADTPDSHLYCW